MSKSKKNSNRWLKIIAVVAVVAIAIVYFFFFSSMSNTGKDQFVYIDDDDNIDSVYNKVEPLSTGHSFATFKMLIHLWGDYPHHIHTGRYTIGSAGALFTFRNMKNGRQTTVELSINSVRTVDRLAEDISKKMMFSKEALLNKLNSAETARHYGYEPETFICMFIPNTYELYWNMSVDKFLDRMKKESDKFWTFERKEKAKAAGLTPNEVITLASIVDEETADNDEKPMIAGLYLNRLHGDMPLQADPTVKYANHDLEAHRIYHNMLTTDSPYNTYRYKGLPPGPIRVPSVEGIEAVLNYTHHRYMYMCAKPTLDGTHSFAETYEEHQKNAKAYADALNERGIK